MKKLTSIVSILLTISLLRIACADQFQIIEKSSGNPVGYVKVVYKNDEYFADSHGRLSIVLDSGSYPMTIFKGNDSLTLNVQIDNSNYLKKLIID